MRNFLLLFIIFIAISCSKNSNSYTHDETNGYIYEDSVSYNSTSYTHDDKKRLIYGDPIPTKFLIINDKDSIGVKNNIGEWIVPYSDWDSLRYKKDYGFLGSHRMLYFLFYENKNDTIFPDEITFGKEIFWRNMVAKRLYTRKEDMRFTTWKELEMYMKKYPDKVEKDYSICEICGSKTIRIYYKTPEWTWRELCGREGPAIVCPHCKLILDMKIEVLS